jgi:hypothetical protein
MSSNNEEEKSELEDELQNINTKIELKKLFYILEQLSDSDESKESKESEQSDKSSYNIKDSECPYCHYDVAYYYKCISCKKLFCYECIYNDTKLCYRCTEDKKTPLEKFNDLYNEKVEYFNRHSEIIDKYEKDAGYNYILKNKNKYQYGFINVCKRRRSI